MANCKKDNLKDDDNEDPEKHLCYIMRWYCARECSKGGYYGKCDVRSLFTLNLEVAENGTFETLDCVCIYNTP